MSQTTNCIKEPYPSAAAAHEAVRFLRNSKQRKRARSHGVQRAYCCPALRRVAPHQPTGAQMATLRRACLQCGRPCNGPRCPEHAIPPRDRARASQATIRAFVATVTRRGHPRRRTTARRSVRLRPHRPARARRKRPPPHPTGKALTARATARKARASATAEHGADDTRGGWVDAEHARSRLDIPRSFPRASGHVSPIRGGNAPPRALLAVGHPSNSRRVIFRQRASAGYF